MKQTSCPYTKISQTEANKLSINNKVTYNDFSNLSLVSTANAQGTVADLGTQIDSQLTVPFYLVIVAFFAFVALMSFVYVYHWQKFSLGDNFIKNYIPIYFVGLIILIIPLLYNLLF